MLVFSAQRQGFDIRVWHPPLPAFVVPGGIYYKLSRFLGWDSYLWGFHKMSHFFISTFNNYIDTFEYTLDSTNEEERIYRMTKNPNRRTLWILDIPSDPSLIRWCSLQDQLAGIEHRKNEKPVANWQWAHPREIMARGHLPFATVRLPVPSKFVRAVVSKPGAIIPLDGEAERSRLTPMDFESQFCSITPEAVLDALGKWGRPGFTKD
jgi:hypothetical protein